MEKSCTKCGEVKPLDGFVVKSANKSGRASYCKECDSARHKKYRKDNRDEVLASRKKYYKDNRDEIAERKKKYYEENPEKGAARTAKYRAALLERIPSWSNDDDIKAIKNIYARCKKINKLTGIEHHVDHVIPMQGDGISGLHHSTNLAIIPAALNLSKNNSWEFQEVHYG